MLFYEVTVSLEAGLDQPFETYMREKHIPEIWATGCFSSIRLDQLDLQRYRTTYAAMEQADLDRYLNEHAEAFRGDFAEHFPSRVNVSREVWTSLAAWP
ncbi:MAG TPA: DUF4286 family protein [Gemmatimonadales bacterium]|nr:DUF4286 family protein [Gemmatimonadales bacterium]